MSSSVVFCPFRGCSFQTELCNLEDHTRTCPFQPVKCPFQSIGCIDLNMSGRSVTEHLNLEPLNHSHLLVEAINHLTNDMDVLKKTNEIEINKLKEELKKNEEVITSITEDNEAKKIQMDELNCKVEQISTELEELRQKDIKKQYKNEELIEEWNEKYSNIHTDMNNKFCQCTEEINTFKSRTTELIPLLKEDFLWTIDDFIQRQGCFYSKPFYKDNYCLCLAAKHGEIFLSLYLHIILGERDNEAQWPMRSDITISIVNQDILRAYESLKCNYETYPNDKSVFDRPTTVMNAGIYVGLMFMEGLAAFTGPMVDNCIQICCSLTSVSDVLGETNE